MQSSYVGIEMGGTKVIVAAGTGPNDLSQTVRLPTQDPQSTMAAVVEAVRTVTGGRNIAGIGVATFGPVGLRPTEANYGHILRTSKPGWTGADVLTPLTQAFPETNLVIDTDVNGAALAEQEWGAARELTDFAYVTVGTGIGVGLVSNGRPVHGQLHPEAGHIYVRRDAQLDPYQGRCPFHGDCLEGLASGPTLFDRTGIQGEDLPADHPVWRLVGEYLSQLYMNLTLVTSPQRIVVGGGLGLNSRVLSFSRDKLRNLLGGYIQSLEQSVDIERFVVGAELGERAGVLGAIAMSKRVKL